MSENSQFCYVDLATSDVGKAQEFYGKLFSWQFQQAPAPGVEQFFSIQTGGGPGAGMFAKPMAEVPTAWTPYVQVKNLGDSVQQAQTLGGEVVVPQTEIGGGMGSFSIVRDPTGGVIGLWQP